jgi:hypothetical protein
MKYNYVMNNQIFLPGFNSIKIYLKIDCPFLFIFLNENNQFLTS